MTMLALLLFTALLAAVNNPARETEYVVGDGETMNLVHFANDAAIQARVELNFKIGQNVVPMDPDLKFHAERNLAP